MFFGCRHKEEDFIYQKELEEAEKGEVLSKLHVAFSRDQEQKVGLCPSTHSLQQPIIPSHRIVALVVLGGFRIFTFQTLFDCCLLFVSVL